MAGDRLRSLLLVAVGVVLGLGLGLALGRFEFRIFTDDSALPRPELLTSVALVVSMVSLVLAVAAMRKAGSLGKGEPRPPTEGRGYSPTSSRGVEREPGAGDSYRSAVEPFVVTAGSRSDDGMRVRRDHNQPPTNPLTPADYDSRRRSLPPDGATEEPGRTTKQAEPELTPDWTGGTSSWGNAELPEAGEPQGSLDGPSDGLSPQRLIQVWEAYLTQGDGRFNAAGMRRQLDAAGIRATVTAGPELGLTDSVLGVSGEGSKVYLFPNFTRPVQSVAQWYADVDAYPRGAAVSGIAEVAIAERVGGRLELRRQGRLA